MAAVEDAGFEVKVTSHGGMEMVRLAVTGMTCGSCANNVERALLRVPGVSQASVSYVTSSAEVMYNSSGTGGLPGRPCACTTCGLTVRDLFAAACYAGHTLLLAPVAAAA